MWKMRTTGRPYDVQIPPRSGNKDEDGVEMVVAGAAKAVVEQGERKRDLEGRLIRFLEAARVNQFQSGLER